MKAVRGKGSMAGRDLGPKSVLEVFADQRLGAKWEVHKTGWKALWLSFAPLMLCFQPLHSSWQLQKREPSPGWRLAAP